MPKLKPKALWMAQKALTGLQTIDAFAQWVHFAPHPVAFQSIHPHYPFFEVPKRNGQKRWIENPTPMLKTIPSRLNFHLQAIYGRIKPVSAYGFILNPDAERYEPRSIWTNAEQHWGKTWLLNADIKDFFHHIHAEPVFRIHSVYFQNLPEIRRQQVLFALDSSATRWVISLFEAKTQLQNDNLKFLQNRKPHLVPKMAQTLQHSEKGLRSFPKFETALLEGVRPHFLGIEGNLAKGYWAIIPQVFDDTTIFEDRNRRPATDRFNVALNYAYGMLYTVVEQACLAAGLDPQLCFFHADDYAKPTLALDMIEPFRPWMDRMLLESFLKREPQENFLNPLKIKELYLLKKGNNG